MDTTLLCLLALVTTVGAVGNYGTFASPANNASLKFRYWLPDASVDTDTVSRDIEEAGAIGAGGVEFLGIYNYGGSLAPQPAGADWATYGFGTPAFNKILKASLQTAKNAGMVYDFALGPNQGQGVPAETTDEGLHWDLAPFNVSIPSNGSYNGRIPGWGTGELVSLVSARVVSSSIIVNPASSLFSTPANNATRLVLATGSLADHTHEVTTNGTVSLAFNVTEQARYHLFAYYQYQDLVKNLDIEENSTGTIFDNGSYTVDHFSGRGAQTTINFWENYILNDTDIKELLQEVGRYGWEDSIEIKSNISWSPCIPDVFEQINGYQLRKYIPLVMYGNNNPGVQPSYPGTLQCVLDSEDQGEGYINDFRAALEKGYQGYLDTLTSWLEGLGLGYSAQISYNLPLNMEGNVNQVDAPECESLAFNNNLDGYRQFSGVANVAQKEVISNEMGADLERAFALPISELLGQINTAFAGGINQIVLHGQSFTGDYYETTWPGYTSFFMLFAESYYSKQPAWAHGFSDAINYVSRNQYVLHVGQPRTDVALYNGVSMTNPQLETLYSSNDMIRAGYTYIYLSPANLNLSQAYVSDGLLAPEAPAYKAIVVTSEQNVTLAGVKALQNYANAGLPVILSGGLPGYYPSGAATDQAAVYAALETLNKSRNVYTTGNGEVASKLEQLNLPPRVAVQTNGTWYPVLRTDNSTDYVYIFSKDSSSEGYITVSSIETPYLFDSWTGKTTPLLHYQTASNTTMIPLRLAANQTIVLAFNSRLKSEVATPSLHAVRLPSNVLGYNYTTTNSLLLHTSTDVCSDCIFQLSNGTTHNLAVNTTTPTTTLTNWTLIAEHWEAPSNMSDASIQAAKRNTTHHLDTLVSWLDIPALQNASGLGYYSASFTWPPTSSSNIDGAYLTLPPIAQGIRVFVNGNNVGPLDLTNPKVDIGPYLTTGANHVTAIVPTMMWNYIRSIFGEIEISGIAPLLSDPLPDRVGNGLIGEVKVIPYTTLHYVI
ncbi:hypothetical protein BO78DRAFT_332935 [Aspergillus sclerotiicarbonarius CBS 121057]|uniref:Secreted protein n=1 Tax=Aspergillus sclerotiicarbonarius (strain CBS 121057 / IBT 28362) TaxID=1448318 RepID=A0A319ER47_ASPSB|nr:hypothetical protein BO78DRAFT_332935 [Aspergillus sclerotiicarbonarius CBS 121057]